MSKDEIKNLLLDFIVEYDPVNWSNEKVYDKFTEIFYRKFADLEAKLAESEEAIKYLKSIKRYDIGEMLTENVKLKQQLAEKQQEKIEYTDTINFVETSEPDIVAKELDRLNQQLEEKEAELENSKNNWNILCDYLGECVIKYDKEDINGIYGEVLSKVNELKRYDYKRHQDKISFALEQLEKVDEFIKSGYCFDLGDVRIEIDNQIKQLKEKK